MIVSFYSYSNPIKRTQLLANLAAYFCFYENKKVLVIDWDLVTPGLHFYFDSSYTLRNKGIIEFLSDYYSYMYARLGGSVQENEIEMRYKKSLNEYIVPNIVKGQNGQIDLMTAGDYANDYIEHCNAFDWLGFYEKLDGGFFIELFKKYLNELGYDYIFINTETGIGRYSGICNVQMPDANILAVCPTHEDIQGCLKVAQNIIKTPYVVKQKHRLGLILPILTGVDSFIERLNAEEIKLFRDYFGGMITDFVNVGVLGSEKEQDGHIEDMRLSGSYLYKEEISFGHDAPKIEKDTYAYKVSVIANRISCCADFLNKRQEK